MIFGQISSFSLINRFELFTLKDPYGSGQAGMNSPMYRGRHAPYPNAAQHSSQKRHQQQQQHQQHQQHQQQQQMNNYGQTMYGPAQVIINSTHQMS